MGSTGGSGGGVKTPAGRLNGSPLLKMILDFFASKKATYLN